MIYEHELRITVTSEVDDDYPDPESIFRAVREQMDMFASAGAKRLKEIVPGATITVVRNDRQPCPAMHCPVYRTDHNMGDEGCIFDAEGHDREY